MRPRNRSLLLHGEHRSPPRQILQPRLNRWQKKEEQRSHLQQLRGKLPHHLARQARNLLSNPLHRVLRREEPDPLGLRGLWQTAPHRFPNHPAPLP